MTSPPSPAFSEMLSSCCSSVEDLDCNYSNSEASSPELKRAKRQNMRSRLENIFISKIHTASLSGTKEDRQNSVQDHTSQLSFTSVDNDSSHDFQESPRSHNGLKNSQNLCCSLPDMNLVAANECKGLDLDCSCCSHSVSEPATEISLELRGDRRDKVVSSYYSHFKQIHSTPLLQNEVSKVESDHENDTKKNEITISKDSEVSDVLYWRNNKISSMNRESVAVVLDDDGPCASKSVHTVETGVATEKDLSPEMIEEGNQCEGNLVDMPALPETDEEDRENAAEVDSVDGTLSNDEVKAIEGFIALLPSQNSPKCNDRNGLVMGSIPNNPTAGLNAPAGENTGNIEKLSPIIQAINGTPMVSPAGESFPMVLNETEKTYEEPSPVNAHTGIMENSKLSENSLETSRDSKNDTDQFLGSRRIEKEFKSELEFTTVLTLAYVRVRELTNSIDKAQEFLANVNKNDDEDDINDLRFKIQALFDSRAALSLEQAKWRSQFSAHFQQRKKALASLKSRASRTEQTYFQLRKELMDLEKEPIIPKRKRSLFSKLFSFRFVK